VRVSLLILVSHFMAFPCKPRTRCQLGAPHFVSPYGIAYRSTLRNAGMRWTPEFGRPTSMSADSGHGTHRLRAPRLHRPTPKTSQRPPRVDCADAMGKEGMLTRGEKGWALTDSYATFSMVCIPISKEVVCASPQGQQQPGLVVLGQRSRTFSSEQ